MNIIVNSIRDTIICIVSKVNAITSNTLAVITIISCYSMLLNNHLKTYDILPGITCNRSTPAESATHLRILGPRHSVTFCPWRCATFLIPTFSATFWWWWWWEGGRGEEICSLQPHLTRYAVLCYVVPCCATLCQFVPRCATRSVMLCHVVLYLRSR